MQIQNRLFSPSGPQGAQHAQEAISLVHDAQGGMVYIPPWLDADTLSAWFAELSQGLPWQALERLMYERMVPVPRLVCSVAVAQLQSAGAAHRRAQEVRQGVVQPAATPVAQGKVQEALCALHQEVSVAVARVGRRSLLLNLPRSVPFTHLGFNYYRSGQDSVALHGDKLHQLQAPWPIAVFSLGAPRTMLIKPVSAVGSSSSLRVLLEPGSLLLMSHASQRTHLHGIPKTAQAVGPRISCALRVRA